MKKQFLAAILPFLVSFSAAAENTAIDSDAANNESLHSALANTDVSGFRVGAGVLNHDSDDLLDDATGYVIEAGYDINKIFGVSGRYSNATFDNDNTQNPSKLPGDVEISTFGLYTDIGYTLIGRNNFTIKPYGLLGVERIGVSTDLGNERFDDSEYAFAIGTGVRATFNKHFVLAAEYKFSSVDVPEYNDLDLDTFSLIVNYKF
ncbi:porin family protein [Photobacterium sanguinicancri]|uniref:Porin family protein n=1 Tax=Photobacterium sanguinicancri TaxID=875932 RepID=A0AAW7XZ67_9GAMM|nr:porin family protein [Photobacterium sanguinicancri]MDO6541426.1 porin family protein [Photobacterium sanguinicancri]